MNEELYTINSEYQEKIEELSELNNDMNNLLSNTGIGALFLDRKKRIRKFTRVAGQLTSIREGDIGRPIQDLATGKIYSGFNEDIEDVFATLATREREMQDPEGDWYMVRMLPYRTEENAVEGVIVTYINITPLKTTEEKAEQLHDRLEKALDVGALSWWDWDVTTDRMAFSSRIEQVIGMDSKQIGQTCKAYRSLIHPEDTGRVKSLVNGMLNGGSKVYDVKYRLKSRDGEYVWVRDRGGVVRRDGQGEALEIAGILANINREKQLEIERDKSYELIYKSLDYSPVAKTVVDRDGVITFANKQARKMLRITESEITNRTYDDGRWRITSGDGKPIPAEDLPFSRVMETGEPVYDFRHYIQVNDHTPILLSISGAPIFDDSERVLSVVFTLDDITAKTERENVIRESEEQYRRLFDCNMDAILVADTERRIMDANPAFEKLFGYTLDELKGRNTKEIYAEQQEHVRMGESLQKQNPEGGFIKTVQYRKKDGTVFPGETSAFHLKDSSGNIRAFVGLIRAK